MAPRIDILSIFPQMFAPFLGTSIPLRAREAGLIAVHTHDIRNWTTDPHRKVDDRPFGGGPGMVFLCDPLADAVEAVEALDPRPARRILLSASGQPLTQARVAELAQSPRIMLICGHYEGVDERAIDALGLEEVSIGDFVLSGGEVAAMVLVDAVTRLQPGALGHEASAAQDSFSISDSGGQPLLDCPHFTRPREWRGRSVPQVLLGGDHKAIAEWRLEQSVARTRSRRPDLCNTRPLGAMRPMSTVSAGLQPTTAC
ncbi:MAG: tRNA (guanosine(37)-N1)-methyltransferase TrmD [Phycisphaerales bacterium]|nr:tRNA (guanosine(37)-N1)-methyltransferase TrmD [Phycisphaerales bacterium]